jgi:stalled ribosome rescue protein Dom34
MDHSESHVLMFDKEHMERELIKSKSHHKHQSKTQDLVAFFKSVSDALALTHEVLLTGPGSTRVEFQEWCKTHAPETAKRIVDCIRSDHPSDGQLVAMAKKYFIKYDNTH